MIVVHLMKQSTKDDEDRSGRESVHSWSHLLLKVRKNKEAPFSSNLVVIWNFQLSKIVNHLYVLQTKHKTPKTI